MTTYTITAELLQELRDYLQAQCGQRCNAEYNPCEAQELDEGLRTLKPNTQEPVAYEFRMRADWVPDWGLWSPCNKEQHEMYLHAPKLHDWIYETRALYAHPAPQAKPLTDEQRNAIFDAVKYEVEGCWQVDFGDVVDAVEAAHGVKP